MFLLIFEINRFLRDRLRLQSDSDKICHTPAPVHAHLCCVAQRSANSESPPKFGSRKNLNYLNLV